MRYKASTAPALKLAYIRCRVIHNAPGELLRVSNSRVIVVVKHRTCKEPVHGGIGFPASVAIGDLTIDTMVRYSPTSECFESAHARVIIITLVVGDALFNEV